MAVEKIIVVSDGEPTKEVVILENITGHTYRVLVAKEGHPLDGFVANKAVVEGYLISRGVKLDQ